MSPERPEDDDFLEDEEHEEYGQRSIFATGWFRAVLVLLVLAVIAVIAVPLIGGWFEPTPPPKVTSPLPPPVQAPAPTPSAPKVETPPPAATPTAPSPPPAAQVPSPAPPSPPAATTPTPLPPVASAPAPKPEIPAAQMPATSPSTPSTPSTKAEKATPRTKATDRTASAPAKSAAKSTNGGSYWVQVGAFKEGRNAEVLAQTLRAEGFPVQVATVTRDEALHVVRIGGYADRAKASAARQELQGKGHSGFVTQGPAK